MRKTLSLIFFATVFWTPPVFARAIDEVCTKETYDAVGQYLRIENLGPRSQGGVIVSESCKSWPYGGNFLLVAFVFDEGIEYEKSLTLALMNKKTKRIVSNYKGVITEDAVTEVGETSLRLDTARYQLSKDVRAFGLRFNSTARGPSCADGASWDELTLFVPEKNNLRPILKMDMQFQNALSGCIGSATDHDVWEYGSRTISVADTVTNGLSDLRIVETITVDTDMDNLPRGVSDKKRVNSYFLKFDGKEYKK
ncbi:MAG: hypothetical protein Q8L15_10680 [Methylobacter sp.]|nr:hypothetical protein [Methylobacter sp.]